MIRVQDLHYSYSRPQGAPLAALRGIDLEIEGGEFVAVVGHNGSGKSTLARHFNALLLPTRGQVLVAGMDTKQEQYLWEIRERVGMVFQNPDNQLVTTMVEEEVAFGAENLGLPRAEIRERVEEALSLLGLARYRHRSPHHLSGGQKQLVAIAGVLAMQPRCIVLDEPTSLLDPEGREEVISSLKRLNLKQGMTVILITHFIQETVGADRIIVMEGGRIALQGHPREVFARTERLKELGQELPVVAELGIRLKKRGLKLSQVPLTEEELIKILCPS